MKSHERSLHHSPKAIELETKQAQPIQTPLHTAINGSPYQLRQKQNLEAIFPSTPAQPLQAGTSSAFMPKLNDSEVLQRIVIEKVDEDNRQLLVKYVNEGNYQAVIDYLLTKLPESRLIGGKVSVTPIDDFAQVVNKEEIPQHGGHAVTIGGKMNQKEKTCIYVNQQYISKWVLGGQIGSLVNTIEHELIHARQMNDDSFIEKYPAKDSSEFEERNNMMEFEAYCGEIRGVSNALNAINYDESKAGSLELPTEAELIKAYNSMEVHYARLSPAAQERVEKNYIIARSNFPTVRDFINRYFTPSSLLDLFTLKYNNFVRNAQNILNGTLNRIQGEKKNVQNEKNTYDELSKSFNLLPLSGINDIKLFNERKQQRESIKNKMSTCRKKQEEADARATAWALRLQTLWNKYTTPTYQVFIQLNTSTQKKYVGITELCKEKNGAEKLKDALNAEKYILSAIETWNEMARGIYLDAGLESPEIISGTAVKMDNVKSLENKKVQPDDPKESYIKELQELMNQNEYVDYWIKQNAPKGLKTFSLSNLRFNLSASRQAIEVWEKIMTISKEKNIDLASGWYTKLSGPKDLYDYYLKLQKG